jgi:hypothetical protein
MTKALFFLWKKGRIVITSLFNKAHPFIRYDIGDIGILDEKHFTKPILQQLIGRTNDIAVLPSGKSAWFNLYYITKNYRGRWKCKKNLRSGKSKPILL